MSILSDDPDADKGGKPDPGSVDDKQQGSLDSKDWRNALPEDLRSDPVFETIKATSVDEALPNIAKQLVNAQGMIGADKLVVPGEHATDEQRNEFFTKLGRPAEAKDYTFEMPEGVKEEDLDTELLDKWKGRLFESGATSAQANKVISEYLADQAASIAAEKAAADKQFQDWETETRTRFGDKLEETTNLAKYAVKEAGNEKFLKVLESYGLGSHPDVIEGLASLGRSISESPTKVGDHQRFSSRSDPASAMAALNAFNRDPEKQRLLHSQKPEDRAAHEAVIKERQELFTLAYKKEDPIG